MSPLIDSSPRPVTLVPLSTTILPGWLATQPEATRRWVAALGWTAAPSTHCLVPDTDGALATALVGVADTPDAWALGALALSLPEGDYALGEGPVALDPRLAALGFALGGYQYTRYKRARRQPARLLVPRGVDAVELRALVGASVLVRDLVNTPTEHMGPEDLASTIQGIGRVHQAQVREWVGDALLDARFPAIHAVGRASHRAPRLIELTWGDARHPAVTIVGKGVCFDTGGLDIKPPDGMRWMKKDMGGAAHAIALAELVMAQRLPLRLRLLVPAVENAISGNAYRPGEVIVTRSGQSVEIDNTDAEGRVILCDALTYAAEARPALVIDFATLTGAARIALGPDLPALFANDDKLADGILGCGRAEHDPLWRMPLWAGYRTMLDSPIADFANSGPSRHAGAITAALYLERFIPANLPWAHIDVYSWNDADRPGRPRGGEAQSLRAVYAWLARHAAAAQAG